MKNIEKIGTKVKVTETKEVESSEYLSELNYELKMIEENITLLENGLSDLKSKKQAIKNEIKDLE
jgi:predicted  nucleic acid-binding Zn-ribbon protein